MSRIDKATIAVIALLMVGIPLAFWGRLPDPAATHFGPGGAPDGNLSKIVWILGTVFFLWMTWVIYLVTRSKAPLTWRAPAVFGAIGALIVAQLSIVWANLDVTTWRDARPVDVPLVLGAFALAYLACGALAFLLERGPTRSLLPKDR